MYGIYIKNDGKNFLPVFLFRLISGTFYFDGFRRDFNWQITDDIRRNLGYISSPQCEPTSTEYNIDNAENIKVPTVML